MKHMWSEEEIQSFKKDISNLVDSKGNPRFIEGNGTPLSKEGFTSTFCKWSLSGSHLMFVLAGTIANGTSITGDPSVAKFYLPDFIFNKIYAVWGGARIEAKTISLFADDWTIQTMELALSKRANYIEFDNTGGTVTATADRHFRVQFDLLIDSE